MNAYIIGFMIHGIILGGILSHLFSINSRLKLLDEKTDFLEDISKSFHRNS